MMASIASISRVDEQGVVRPPAPGDAIGSALRGVYGHSPTLPDDMLRLLRTLDQPSRSH